MCRVQLGKLRDHLGRLREAGAAVFAISNDHREDARRMADELQDGAVVLSDPSMRLIYRYGMKGHRMRMADMGYVVIDRAGVVRARTIDRQFGEHADDIVKTLIEHAGGAGPSRGQRG